MKKDKPSKEGFRILEAFLEAWNRHEIDSIMTFMCDDCIYEASAGPDSWGRRFEGKEQVGQAFAAVWTAISDARWSDARHWVCDDRGASEWLFTGTRADGTRIEVCGCDLYTLREGKIAVKSTFLKSRVATPPAK